MLSSMSSSGSGGVSVEAESNVASEVKKEDVRGVSRDEHRNTITAPSWRQAAFSSNIRNPQSGGCDYVNPETGTPTNCLVKLPGVDCDNITRWSVIEAPVWCELCNPDNVPMDNFSAVPRGAMARNRNLAFMREVTEVGFRVANVHLTVCRRCLCIVCPSHWNAEIRSCIKCNGEHVRETSSFDERDDRIGLESTNHFMHVLDEDDRDAAGFGYQEGRNRLPHAERNNNATRKPFLFL